MVFRFFIATLVTLLAAQSLDAAETRPALALDAQAATVCPATGQPSQEPDFASAKCERHPLWQLDPQGRHLWVEVYFDWPESESSTAPRPLGLFVSAKASSKVWLNGQPLGVNGLPASSAGQEIAGRMDTVFFVPRDLLQAGSNRLVLEVSAMHGSVRLHRPMHFVGLAPYQPGSERFLGFLPALLTFGLFLAGVAYFAVSAWRGYDREGSAILATASLAAAM